MTPDGRGFIVTWSRPPMEADSAEAAPRRASFAVELDLKRVELAMVLDITGSMAVSGKLDAMKVAAKEVIDLLIDPSARR